MHSDGKSEECSLTKADSECVVLNQRDLNHGILNYWKEPWYPWMLQSRDPELYFWFCPFLVDVFNQITSLLFASPSYKIRKWSLDFTGLFNAINIYQFIHCNSHATWVLHPPSQLRYRYDWLKWKFSCSEIPELALSILKWLGRWWKWFIFSWSLYFIGLYAFLPCNICRIWPE